MSTNETETETITTTEPATDSTALTADEVKGLVVSALSDAGVTKENIDRLNVLSDLDSRIEGIVEKHKSAPADNSSLLKDVEKMLDDKLRGIHGANVGRRIGPLGRYLGFGRN